MPYDEEEDFETTTDPGEVSPAHRKILAQARKHFDLCVEAERKRRELALDDLKFRAGEGQWDEQIREARKAAKKPCITINVLPARERQVLNDLRQNRKMLKVSAVSADASQETAEILQGILKHIEYISHADVCYDTANAAVVRTGGPGWVRIVDSYDDEKSFQRIPKLERVRNQFQVYDDPSSLEPDGLDSNLRFYFEDLTKEDFKQQYPQASLASLDDWTSVGDIPPDWLSENGVRVCEYFWKEMTADTAYELQKPNGDTRKVLKSELKGKKLPKGVKILQQRPTETSVIHHYKLSAYDVLEEAIWDGKWIPGVPFYGDELDVDGELIYEGMVRHTKDPIRMQNAMASAEVTAIAVGTVSPWLAAAGQTEDFPEWKTGNIDIAAVLRYLPSVLGQPVGPPVRNVSEPPIQAISQARLQFTDDIKAITGIYDAQLGARSNENSGKAINARKQQGEISNFHYGDNCSRAMRAIGMQLLDQIQRKMTAPQVARTIGEDDVQKMVKINQHFTEGGVRKIFDLDLGTYDVILGPGGSAETKQQEDADRISQLVSAYPPLMQIAGDLVVGLLDIHSRDLFVERLRKTLPPGLVPDDGTDPQVAAQKAQAQLTQISQQHEMLVQHLQQATQVIQTKQVEQQGKIQAEQVKVQGQLALAAFERVTKLMVANVEAKTQDAQARLEIDADLEAQLHDQAHDAAMQAQGQVHAQQNQQQAAAAQSTQSAQDSQQAQDAQAQQAQQAQAAQPDAGATNAQ